MNTDMRRVLVFFGSAATAIAAVFLITWLAGVQGWWRLVAALVIVGSWLIWLPMDRVDR